MLRSACDDNIAFVFQSQMAEDMAAPVGPVQARRQACLLMREGYADTWFHSVCLDGGVAQSRGNHLQAPALPVFNAKVRLLPMSCLLGEILHKCSSQAAGFRRGIGVG